MRPSLIHSSLIHLIHPSLNHPSFICKFFWHSSYSHSFLSHLHVPISFIFSHSSCISISTTFSNSILPKNPFFFYWKRMESEQSRNNSIIGHWRDARRIVKGNGDVVIKWPKSLDCHRIQIGFQQVHKKTKLWPSIKIGIGIEKRTFLTILWTSLNKFIIYFKYKLNQLICNASDQLRLEFRLFQSKLFF